MIEKIKAEIERRREKCADIAADASNEEVAEYYRGKEVAYDETLSLIESLEKEQKDVFGDHLSELIPTPINIPPISEDAKIVEDSAHLGIHGESLGQEHPKKINVTGDDFSWIDELKHDLEHPEELDERVAEALRKKQSQGLDEPSYSKVMETLNQVLIDWRNEAKTEEEKESRFEAHKRFFEIYDEAMMVDDEPQGLDEAAKQIAYDVCKELPTRWSGGDKDTVVYYAILAAIAGAKWMAEQFDLEADGEITQRPDGTLGVCIYIDERSGYKFGDRVIVQIRKKEE